MGFDCQNGKKLIQTPISKSNVTSVVHSAELNQLFVGSGNGQITCFYDPDLSGKDGILRCIVKKEKRKIENEAFDLEGGDEEN